MDDQQLDSFKALGEEIDHLFDDVENALDEHASFSLRLSTRAKVEEVVKRFRDAQALLPTEEDRMQIDRSVGRKLRDLQKMAGPLPAPPSGTPTTRRASDDFFEARPISASSSRQPRVAGVTGPPRTTGPSVGGEIDAWCNRCEGIHTHTILAVSGGSPVQVTCHACKSTHKYREAPPLKKPAPVRPTAASYQPTASEMEAQKKARERRELIDQLNAAESVRKYDPKERYKAGEIVEHPELGRGKIENTLPRSMLVRFPVGLKTLKLG